MFQHWGFIVRWRNGNRLEELERNTIDTRCHKNLALTGSNPVLTAVPIATLEVLSKLQ